MLLEKQQMSYQFFTKLLSKWGFTRAGLINNKRGEWYLLIQVSIILLHISPAWPHYINISTKLKLAALLLFLYGLTKFIKALKTLGNNLSPLPEPIATGKLITKGIYQKSRHPLYKALILISASIVILKASIFHFILFLLLIVVLIKKAKREEISLKLRYKEYNKYLLTTPAIFNGLAFLDWRK